MTTLAADRDTPSIAGKNFSYPMAAATEIFKGSLVVLDSSGNAEPATDASGKVAVGRAAEYINNTGIAAAKSIDVEPGVFRWANSGSNTPTKANIGDMLYIVDDQTVDTLATSSSPAGVMVDIDDLGSWVRTEPPTSLAAGLLAANNLSDVGTLATAQTNMGIGTADVPVLAGVSVGAATALIKTAKVTLTATQIKALATTPITLVAAVADKFHQFLGASFKYNYGSEILAEPSAPDDMQVKYVDGTGVAASSLPDSGQLLVPAADQYAAAIPLAVEGGTLAEHVNVPLVLFNTGANFTGNASDDATLEVTVSYIEHDMS